MSINFGCKTKEQIYYFSFLTPVDFDNFFGMLKKGNFTGFKSKIDAELAPQNRNNFKRKRSNVVTDLTHSMIT